MFSQTGTLPNPLGLGRVTIGVADAAGKRAALILHRGTDGMLHVETPQDEKPAADNFQCCVEGCTERTDARNTMYCTAHFLTVGVGATLEQTEGQA